MSDLAGRTLGAYQIIRELGHGGMANVYLASQLSVGREVAVKVLPATFLQDRSFLERFNRELRTIAKLQHPRILPVYDSGEQDGQPYIVMAYMPGGTLSELIRDYGGQMPLDEVARLVGQIAEGLDFAHKRGVIHRDFKPSNVLLDEEGNVHLADFGIAKATAETAQLTGSGMVGTPGYMAPEMSRPGGVSALLDIYALGVTLFEMVTGNHPYHADTPIGVIMAHATEPVPDARDLRPDLPDGVQSVIERAMAKIPSERYPTARDLVEDMRQAISDGGVAEPQRRAAEPVMPENVLIDEGVTVPTPQSQPTVPAPPSPQRSPLVGRVVQRAPEPQTPPVELTAPVVGRQGPVSLRRPGRWLIAIVVGVVVIAGVIGGIVLLARGGIAKVEAVAAGASRDYSKITQMTGQAGGDISPIFTVDKNLLIFSTTRTEPQYNLYSMGLTGSIVGQITRMTSERGDCIQPTFSPDGNLLLFSSNRDGRYHLYSMLWTGNQAGQITQVTSGNSDDLAPTFSPDGNLLLFSSNRDGRYHLYSMLWTGGQIGQISPVTSGSSDDLFSTFSPDGNLLIFSSNRDGRYHLYSMVWKGDLQGQINPITSGGGNDIQPAFSPDSLRLAFASDRAGNWDIYLTPWGGGKIEVTQVTTGGGQELFPRFSADGGLLVFSSGTYFLSASAEPFFFMPDADLYSAGAAGK